MKVDEERRSRAGAPVTAAPVEAPAGQGPSELVLAYEDNRLATQLFGLHDQNLAFIERRLGIEATARGNHVALRGSRDGVEQAKKVLDELYQRLRAGQTVALGDVDGALRMSSAQGVLFNADATARDAKAGAAIGGAATVGTRKKTIAARTHAQDSLYPRPAAP